MKNLRLRRRKANGHPDRVRSNNMKKRQEEVVVPMREIKLSIQKFSSNSSSSFPHQTELRASNNEDHEMEMFT